MCHAAPLSAGPRNAARLPAAALAMALVACSSNETPASRPSPAVGKASRSTVQPERVLTEAPSDVRCTRIVLHTDDALHELLRAGLSREVIDTLDNAFVGRLDLFAHLRTGSSLTVWTASNTLVGAKLEAVRAPPFVVARYDGALAPHGFYDVTGNAMHGIILARPVPLSRITSRFGARFDAISNRPADHHGIDYGVPIGTPVVAVGDGRVVVAASSASAGNFIEIRHAQGYESRYLHLSSIDAAIRVGAIVKQGQLIGLSGNTGRSTGPHLHYELHVAGIPLDPLATLALPVVALGPTARREHLAFIQHLEAQHDGRADEQDEHP